MPRHTHYLRYIKVNGAQCHTAFGSPVAIAGLNSGTHAITVNLIAFPVKHQDTDPADSTAAVSNEVRRSYRELIGPQAGEGGIENLEDTLSTPKDMPVGVAASDTVLVDVVGPGWNGAEEIQDRIDTARKSNDVGVHVRKPGSLDGDDWIFRNGHGDDGDAIVEMRLDRGSKHGVTKDVSMSHDSDGDRIGEKELGGEGSASPGGKGVDGRKSWDGQSETSQGTTRIAIVSNNLQDHSQNRAFVKLCVGLSTSRYVKDFGSAR